MHFLELQYMASHKYYMVVVIVRDQKPVTIGITQMLPGTADTGRRAPTAAMSPSGDDAVFIMYSTLVPDRQLFSRLSMRPKITKASSADFFPKLSLAFMAIHNNTPCYI